MAEDGQAEDQEKLRDALVERLVAVAQTRQPNRPIPNFDPPAAGLVEALIATTRSSSDGALKGLAQTILAAIPAPDVSSPDCDFDQVVLYARITELHAAARRLLHDTGDQAWNGCLEDVYGEEIAELKRYSRQILEKIEQIEAQSRDNSISVCLPGLPVAVSLGMIKEASQSVSDTVAIGGALAAKNMVACATAISNEVSALLEAARKHAGELTEDLREAIMELAELCRRFVRRVASFTLRYLDPDDAVARAARRLIGWRRSRPSFGPHARLALDMGTSVTRLYRAGLGVVLVEPTISAEDSARRRAYGAEALRLEQLGSHTDLALVRDGVIDDFHAAQAFIGHLVGHLRQDRGFGSYEVMATVPAGATAVERRALSDCCLHAGARHVSLIDTPLAAALGAGVLLHEPAGSLVAVIGAGFTEIAVLSLSSIVYSRSVRTGGEVMNEALMRYIAERHDVLIPAAAAERIKREIGSAAPISVGSGRFCEVEGREKKTRAVRRVRIDAHEAAGVLFEQTTAIVDAVKLVLECLPPELAGDIADKGMVVMGGGCLLRGLPFELGRQTGLPVTVAADPMSCVILGCGRILEQPDLARMVME